MNWQLNKIQYPVYNLGPGKRMGIWVQGCSIRCPGCINKSTWPGNKGKSLDMLSVTHMVSDICRDYDGITITGGEPFDQYPQLMVFASVIKRRTALNLLCYTGYYLSELEQMFPDHSFFNCLDYIIDGRYEQRLPSVSSMKGSGNQSVYEIADHKARKTDMADPGKLWSLNFESDVVYMAGIPAKDEVETMLNNLSSDTSRFELV